MAIKDSDYESNFTIPEPIGVYQGAGDTNISTKYAYIAQNIYAERGILASAAGTSQTFLPLLGFAAETLERFYRRNRPDDPEVFVAAANGTICTYTMGDPKWTVKVMNLESNVWSCVNYEAVRNNETVDILIMSNSSDGMYVVYGDDLSVEKIDLLIGDDNMPVKFSALGRYAERIWGIGDPDNPDTIFYSKPYRPFDWNADTDKPSIGGGFIQYPTWDGDAFVAIASYGSYLVASKRNTLVEIRGTNPTNFQVAAAYGTDGPVYAPTVCVDQSLMLFLSRAGIGMYDGSTISLLSKNALYETMSARIPELEYLATACICDHIYYLAIACREEGKTVECNNTVIEFDTLRSTFMIRKGISVKDFYAINGKIYCTLADLPYRIIQYNDIKSSAWLRTPMECIWETAWLDLDKYIKKRDFVLRFTAEADMDDTPVNMTIITDKREKQRCVMLQKNRKDYRVKIQNSGVRVKLRITSKTIYGWRIYGGVRVEFTHDKLQK